MIFTLPSWAQNGESYGDLMTSQVRSGKLSSPERLRSFIVDGKLHLSLRDAVVLTLENNSQIRVQQTQVQSSKFALLETHAPFDPTFAASYNVNDSVTPPFSALQGTGSVNVNLKNTIQFAQFNYTQEIGRAHV